MSTSQQPSLFDHLFAELPLAKDEANPPGPTPTAALHPALALPPEPDPLVQTNGDLASDFQKTGLQDGPNALGAWAATADADQADKAAPPKEQAWLLDVGGPSKDELTLSIRLDDRMHQLVLGSQGLSWMRGGTLLGESGWAAFIAFMGHQHARLATLIGSRKVPPSLLEHPEFSTGILPHLYVNAYHGDRLVRGALRRRVEVRASEPETVEKLMAVEVACANPDCLHSIRPFRPRAKGNPLRLFVGFTCPLEESVACARTRGAKEAMEALVLRLEALGQFAGNDVQR